LLLRGEEGEGQNRQSVLMLSRALHHLVLAISRNIVAAPRHGTGASLPHTAAGTTETIYSIRGSAALYADYYLQIISARDMGRDKQGSIPECSPSWRGVEVGTVPFTCSPSVPHVLDWVIDCIRSTATGQGSDLPSFFTSDSLASSLFVNSNRLDSPRDAYPAIAFNKKLFASLSVSARMDGAVGESSPPPGCSKWLYAVANAFVKTSNRDLSSLSLIPPPLRALIELALHQCKEAPFFPLDPTAPAGSTPQAWPSSVLTAIGRNDLCAHLKHPRTGSKGAVVAEKSREISSSYKRDESISLDGLSEIEEEACRLRFADDDRVHEVCRLLRSSAGVYLRLEKAPEVSDLDHRHKLQMRLLILCRRSLACPVGRGALTLGSLTPLMAEALPCPPLSLSGRIPPNNTPLPLHTVTAPQDLSLWPEFHNGVAAGLRVSSPEELDPGTRTPGTASTPASASISTGNRFAGASTVTRNWIVYNRTATADDSSFHAGVLLALGLQGHLRVLSVTDICDYLTQGNQPTTIALLVGLPASRLGTADPLLSKTLCLHVPSLLPPQHWDIEILPQVQTAALVGLGLLYCNSGHRLMTEFLSAELGRRHTADRDRGDCREAVSFAAAWALGVVLLGKGKAKGKTVAFSLDKSAVGGLGGLADLCIEDRLYQHLEGGKRPPDSNLFPYAGVPQGDGHAAGGRSSRVMEGDQLNTGVTGPGAAVALGLIYIRSGNQEICRRLSLPQTAFALDSIRPDLLLYRAVARCLVLWDAVEPTAAWIDSQTPDAVTRSLFPTKGLPENKLPSRRETRGKVELDPRSALSVYLNVVTGHCWGIGLVFAGTANETARDTLLEKLKMLQGLRENKLPFPLPFTPNTKSLRPLVEGCIGSVALALACVMAGTGDLSCLRMLRLLRWKVDDVTYGTHLSLAMAIGILFLSGGSASLRRDPMSCACLLLATAPRFPIRTVDNQYHLQALRHLYVLAVETRALQIIDADLGSAVSVEIEIELVSGEKLLKRAPCLLPELITVRAVRLPSASSSLYYPASMVITPLESGTQQSISRIPHPLYVKRRPLLALSSRALPSVKIPDQSAHSGQCSQSLLGGLKSHIAGGRQGGTRGMGAEIGSIGEAGRIESQLSLDYLLLAAVEPLGVRPGRGAVGMEAGSINGSAVVIEMETADKSLQTPVSATMSDIALALTTAGSMTEGIFLQAMIESVVTE
jgi:hypothetical protein